MKDEWHINHIIFLISLALIFLFTFLTSCESFINIQSFEQESNASDPESTESVEEKEDERNYIYRK